MSETFFPLCLIDVDSFLRLTSTMKQLFLLIIVDWWMGEVFAPPGSRSNTGGFEKSIAALLRFVSKQHLLLSLWNYTMSRHELTSWSFLLITFLISVLWKKFKIWSQASQGLNIDSSTTFLLDLGQLPLPLCVLYSMNLESTSARIAFLIWFLPLCGHKVEGLCVQKRKGRW